MRYVQSGRLFVCVILLAGLGVPSCKGSNENNTLSNSSSATKVPAPNRPSLATKRDASAHAPRDTENSLKEHMQDHFSAIQKIQRAIVAGNLDEAKKQANWLEKHRRHDAIDSWEPHLDRVRGSARKLAQATTLPQAAMITANLAYQCGSCHLHRTAITTFGWTAAPTAKNTFADKMRSHQWAADRLWEGLASPSDSVWQQGAAALADTPIPVEEILRVSNLMNNPAASKTIRTLGKQVHALGQEARSTKEREKRADLYGELLKTCSSCHSLAQPPKQ